MNNIEQAGLVFRAETLPEAIAITERERLHAMIAADVAGLADTLSDDLVYVHSSGAADGKRSYLDVLSGVLSYSYLNYGLIRGTALSTESYVAVGTLSGIAEARGEEIRIEATFSAGWTLTDRWRLTFWYSGPPSRE